jgi:hypothetical protein
MKPIVLQAQVKELLNYMKSSGDLSKTSLLEINKKLLKIMSEVTENLEKVG